MYIHNRYFIPFNMSNFKRPSNYTNVTKFEHNDLLNYALHYRTVGQYTANRTSERRPINDNSFGGDIEIGDDTTV